MDQRESLQLPFALVGKTFGKYGKSTFAVKLGKYFIDNGLSDMPMLFLNRNDIHLAIQDALEYAKKLDLSKNGVNVYKQLQIHDTLEPLECVETDITQLVAKYTIESTSKIVMCVIQFEDSGNALCMVGGGSSQNYYAIDIANRIFCVTTSPEYDIPNYAERFSGNNGTFKATFWVQKGNAPALPDISPPSSPPRTFLPPTTPVVVAKEPVQKKAKKTLEDEVEIVEEKPATATATKRRKKVVTKKQAVATTTTTTDSTTTNSAINV